jgi:hypothetical protein
VTRVVYNDFVPLSEDRRNCQYDVRAEGPVDGLTADRFTITWWPAGVRDNDFSEAAEGAEPYGESGIVIDYGPATAPEVTVEFEANGFDWEVRIATNLLGADGVTDVATGSESAWVRNLAFTLADELSFGNPNVTEF